MVLIVSIPQIQDYPFTHGIFILILTELNNGLAVRGEKLVKKKIINECTCETSNKT